MKPVVSFRTLEGEKDWWPHSWASTHKPVPKSPWITVYRAQRTTRAGYEGTYSGVTNLLKRKKVRARLPISRAT